MEGLLDGEIPLLDITEEKLTAASMRTSGMGIWVLKYGRVLEVLLAYVMPTEIAIGQFEFCRESGRNWRVVKCQSN